MATATKKDNEPTLVAKAIAEWRDRLEALRPAVDEAREIEQALEAVGQTTAAPRRRRGGGRRRGSGRAKEFVALVVDNPGITVADAAKQMKINPNYLYRVANGESDRGTVRKEGQGYHPTEKATAASGNGDDDS